MEHSLKLGLVEQYVEHQEILHILPHARFPYLTLTLGYSIGITALGAVRNALGGFGDDLQWLMGIIGLAVFAKYIYDFLDRYMDTVILTNKGITVVRIDGRFKYQVDFFERKNIASISHTQSGIVGKILNQGSIHISLDHDSDYTVDGVSGPGKQSSIINKYKFDTLSRISQEDLLVSQIEEQPDKFEILVDTLSEVIGTYMRNNPK